jgi:hypothetical protein
MSDQIYTGKGSFLKNYLAGRPPVVPRMSRHHHALEEPEPTLSLAASMRATGLIDEPGEFTGPEFDFEGLH